MKIKHVYGNVLRLDIPLTVKIVTSEGGHTQETEEPFYPDTSKSVLVELANKYNITKYTYEATMNGNVAHIEDYGDIKVGIYKVTVKCYDGIGNPYRYMVRDIIEVCDATIDAGIEAGVEFNAETYTLEGAVFVSYGGGSFEQEQADWTEADIHSKAYIKHKPTNLVEDENYVHTDNNYTDEEKEKLADLENYDDSGIRQEIDDKVDKVDGKGLSTNDYTNEDKQKVNNALQSETDPTVPQWAKNPTKPSYNAQEVGALPDTTPIPSQTSDLINNSGFITKTVDDLVNYYLKRDIYTKDEVQQIVSAIKQFRYEVVPTLPEPSAETMHCIYLVPSADPQAQNIKDEYITIQSDSQRDVYFWEQIGSTAIDLSGYYTSSETDSAISAALTAALADYTTTEALTRLLAGKQDKEAGKGLSTNDFTDADKAKVDALKTVATTGSYNDLTDKPTIPSFAMTKTVTVDYLQNADTVQWTNLYGNITVNYVAGVNVATLKVSHGSVLEQVVPMGSASINIDSNEVVTMKITRTSDLQDSCVSMRFGERTA